MRRYRGSREARGQLARSGSDATPSGRVSGGEPTPLPPRLDAPWSRQNALVVPPRDHGPRSFLAHIFFVGSQTVYRNRNPFPYCNRLGIVCNMGRPSRNPAEPSTETLSFRVTKTEMQALDTQAEVRGVTRVEAARIALTLLGQPPLSSKPPVTHAVETVPATRPRVPTQPFIQTDPKVTKRTPASQCLAQRGTQRISGVIVCKECGKPYADHLR